MRNLQKGFLNILALLAIGVLLIGGASYLEKFQGSENVGAGTGTITKLSGGGGTTTFLGLTDTPNAYTGEALKVVQVNAGETALEFVTLSGGGDALTANPLSQFASTTSAQLAGVISNETGTGLLVYNDSPTLITPALGTPASGVATNLTGTATALNIGGNAATVTFADAGGDTTTFVALGTAATGSLAPATDAGLTFNATTNALTATTFIGFSIAFGTFVTVSSALFNSQIPFIS